MLLFLILGVIEFISVVVIKKICHLYRLEFFYYVISYKEWLQNIFAISSIFFPPPFFCLYILITYIYIFTYARARVFIYIS